MFTTSVNLEYINFQQDAKVKNSFLKWLLETIFCGHDGYGKKEQWTGWQRVWCEMWKKEIIEHVQPLHYAGTPPMTFTVRCKGFQDSSILLENAGYPSKSVSTS